MQFSSKGKGCIQKVRFNCFHSITEGWQDSWSSVGCNTVAQPHNNNLPSEYPYHMYQPHLTHWGIGHKCTLASIQVPSSTTTSSTPLAPHGPPPAKKMRHNGMSMWKLEESVDWWLKVHLELDLSRKVWDRTRRKRMWKSLLLALIMGGARTSAPYPCCHKVELLTNWVCLPHLTLKFQLVLWFNFAIFSIISPYLL